MPNLIELRPMTPEFIEAVLDGRRDDAAAEVGAELPDGYPAERQRRFLELRLRQMRKDERFLEWCPHVVVVGGRVVGGAGYHGPPGVNGLQKPGAVEFGYETEEQHRGRGYATAAAERLIELAAERGVSEFVLSCGPQNEASLAIIRKLGFVEAGEVMDEEDGLELVFERKV